MGKKIDNFANPVLRTDEFTPNLTPAIDGVGIGENKGPVKRVAMLSASRMVRKSTSCRAESLVGGGVLIHIHADHYQLRHLAL